MLIIAVDPQDRAQTQRNDPLMAAIFRAAQRIAIEQPGQLIGDLFALRERHRHLDREAALRMAGNSAFDAAELVEINHDPLADVAADRCIDRKTTRRHVDCLTGEFPPIGEHITAKQLDVDARVAPPFSKFGLYLELGCHLLTSTLGHERQLSIGAAG